MSAENVENIKSVLEVGGLGERVNFQLIPKFHHQTHTAIVPIVTVPYFHV